MARERLYGWNGEMPEKPVSGQALIVLNALRAEPKVLRTGKEWTSVIGGNIATRQDPYRVVLYYLIILKGKGCIRTNEYDIDATTRREDVKHRVTVVTRGGLKTGEVIEEPKPAAEPVAAE